MLEILTRKKDMHDNFLNYHAGCVLEVYLRKLCVTVSLPCGLCARSLYKKDMRDSFRAVQAVSSRFTQERSA